MGRSRRRTSQRRTSDQAARGCAARDTTEPDGVTGRGNARRASDKEEGQVMTETVGSPAGTAGEPDTDARDKGIRVQRVYTTEGVHPYDEVTWERRSADISAERFSSSIS